MENALVNPIQLVVGLGNPGGQYRQTRHNIGFEVVDALCGKWSISTSESRRFKGTQGDGAAVSGRRIVLLKPSTFMNRSGEAVRAVVDWYKLQANSVLIVYDDMDLPLGRLRLRPSGSAGGHNGMKSVITHLGTQEFPRLRVGIGNTQKGTDRDGAVVSHVLGRFTPDEKPLVRRALEWAVEAVETTVCKDVEAAMNQFNGRIAS